MTSKKFERASRWIRFKAFFVAILLHLALIGGIIYATTDNSEEGVTKTIKDLIEQIIGREEADGQA